MLRKEIRDVLIQSAWACAAATVMPAVLTFFLEETFFEIFFPLFQVGLLFWAFFLGNFLFFLERGQGGLEYLFSLPYSRRRLIGNKILPRAIAVVLFFFIHLFIYHNGGANAAAFNLSIHSLAYVSLFAIGFSLCCVSENFVVSFSSSAAAFLASAGLACAAVRLGITLQGLEFPGFFDLTDLYSPGKFALWIAVLLPAAAFPLAFLLSSRSLDIRPAARFNRIFFKRLGVLLPAFFLVSSLIGWAEFKNPYTSYYLTRTRRLIESRGSRVRLYAKDDVLEIETLRSFLWWGHAVEEGGHVFIDADIGGKLRHGHIVDIDLENGIVEPLYDTRARMGFEFWKDGRELLVLERSGKEGGLVLARIDIDTREVIRLPVEHPSLRTIHRGLGYRFLLVGADRLEGKRFWLLASERPWKHPLLQIWEDGAVSDLGFFPRRPQLLRRHLFAPREDHVDIFRISPAGLEPMPAFPGRLWLWPPRRDFTLPVESIFGKLHGTEPVMLDLEDLRRIPIDPPPGRIFHRDYRDYYSFESSDGLTKFWLWRKDEFRLVQEIAGRNAVTLEDRRIWFSGSGIMVRQEGRLKIYELPDFEELIFKGFKGK